MELIYKKSHSVLCTLFTVSSNTTNTQAMLQYYKVYLKNKCTFSTANRNSLIFLYWGKASKYNHLHFFLPPAVPSEFSWERRGLLVQIQENILGIPLDVPDISEIT